MPQSSRGQRRLTSISDPAGIVLAGSEKEFSLARIFPSEDSDFSRPTCPRCGGRRAGVDGAAHAESAKSPLTGFWQAYFDDGGPSGWFYFAEKNGFYEGRLVKMFKKRARPRW